MGGWVGSGGLGILSFREGCRVVMRLGGESGSEGISRKSSEAKSCETAKNRYHVFIAWEGFVFLLSISQSYASWAGPYFGRCKDMVYAIGPATSGAAAESDQQNHARTC